MSEEKESLRSVYEKELNYLDGDVTVFLSGGQYVSPCHEFALDLDIFGQQSLFHRINRTIDYRRQRFPGEGKGIRVSESHAYRSIDIPVVQVAMHRVLGRLVAVVEGVELAVHIDKIAVPVVGDRQACREVHCHIIIVGYGSLVF